MMAGVGSFCYSIGFGIRLSSALKRQIFDQALCQTLTPDKVTRPPVSLCCQTDHLNCFISSWVPFGRLYMSGAFFLKQIPSSQGLF